MLGLTWRTGSIGGRKWKDGLKSPRIDADVKEASRN